MYVCMFWMDGWMDARERERGDCACIYVCFGRVNGCYACMGDHTCGWYKGPSEGHVFS